MSKKKGSYLNKFFDKIYVINLFDNVDRWKTVEKQFKSRNIKVDRFIAVDGRCKSQGKAGCLEKMKSFEIMYDIKVDYTKLKKMNMKAMVPAASLTIGTIILLRDMVKHKRDYILICEDDINLSRDFEHKFKRGIKEIGTKKWDLLYLGCGNKCGYDPKHISDTKQKNTPYLMPWFESEDDEGAGFVSNRDDLRILCDECESISKHISIPMAPGGTWCYAYSLSGAKKILKFIDNNPLNHIDQILIKSVKKKKVKAFAFNPPIVYHEDIRSGRNTDIPW